MFSRSNSEPWPCRPLVPLSVATLVRPPGRALSFALSVAGGGLHLADGSLGDGHAASAGPRLAHAAGFAQARAGRALPRGARRGAGAAAKGQPDAGAVDGNIGGLLEDPRSDNLRGGRCRGHGGGGVDHKLFPAAAAHRQRMQFSGRERGGDRRRGWIGLLPGGFNAAHHAGQDARLLRQAPLDGLLHSAAQLNRRRAYVARSGALIPNACEDGRYRHDHMQGT